ncbi:MAG TPA: VOC family protein [Candidatus Acidoferrales bacterium]|jgi:PhnB protein|nr:VOC family protein [Candidatus Acidoferrales bacterium]
MQLNAYLLFKGNCEEAFKFYERALGGKIEAMIPHAGTPAEKHVSPEWRDKIMHARLAVGNAVLMGSDAPMDKFDEPKGFSVSIHTDDPAEAERLFQALEKDGTVKMPLQQTFWAVKFGMLVDRFGIPWMVNCQQAAQQASS